MRAIAVRYGRRGASDATDDLAQDLALAALEGGAGAERPGAWLERVGRNAAIDRWRVDRRRGDLARAVEPPPAPADPEAALLARERRGLVRRALAALPRPQRRAALLRFHCELPFEDVASRLGTVAATARTRVHRALAELRAQVRGLGALLVGWGWPASQVAVAALVLAVAVPEPAPAPGAVVRAPGVRAARVVAQAAARPSPPVPASAPAAPAPAAAAQRARPPARPAPQPRPLILDFENDKVEGSIARPDGVSVPGDVKARQPSLIELRWSLQPEILKSLEEL
jgi:RNA polymerase sigma factor (sigma-70 family)